jgi:transposase
MYSTDLTDSQWEVIQLYLPVQRKRKYSLRAVVNATLYLLKTGCQWRMLPVDFRLISWFIIISGAGLLLVFGRS